MNPLSALRDFAIRGELDKIIRVGNEFRFGEEHVFPCNAVTAYRSKSGELFTLDVLIFFLQKQELKHNYVVEARRNGVASVSFPDRKPLLDYLLGRVSTTDAIEFLPNAAAPTSGNEEYRPEDAQILSPSAHPSSIGFNLEEAFDDGVRKEGDEGLNLNARVRDSNRVDYVKMIMEVERPLRDRNSLLQSRNRDFYSIYKDAMEREEKMKRMDSQQRKDGLVAKSRLMGADERAMMMMGISGGDDLGFDSKSSKKRMKGSGGKIGEGVPIILVPSASNTLITIYNVKELLEDGVFIPTDVKMKQMVKAPKPECVTVQKKFGRDKERAVQAYEVRDKPSALKSEDWDRVVAVFVLGKEWQFKDWPYKDHVEIFNKIVGFFVRFEDDSVESAKTVKQWNVKIISISKNKRHQDRAAALEVWDRLENFMKSRSHS